MKARASARGSAAAAPALLRCARVFRPVVRQRELLRCELPRWLLRPPLRIGAGFSALP